MSKKAQQTEDRLNLAEYKLQKAEEQNKELRSMVDNLIESAKRSCDSAMNYTAALSSKVNENNILKNMNEDLWKQLDERVNRELVDGLHLLWYQAALHCLKDQLLESESTNRCIATIIAGDKFDDVKDAVIAAMRPESDDNCKIKLTGDQMYTILMRYFADTWTKINEQYS